METGFFFSEKLKKLDLLISFRRIIIAISEQFFSRDTL